MDDQPRALADDQPILPTTIVGSYPVPEWFEALRAAEGPTDPSGEATADAHWAVVDELERTGLDVVTDGEVGRRDMLTRFVAPIEGCELADGDGKPLRVTGQLATRGLGLDDEYERAASVADRPVKLTVTGPLTLAYSCKLPQGSDRVATATEFADLLADAVARATAAGADYVQIDEPALGTGDGDLAARCLRRVLEPVDDSVRVGLHACSSDPHAAFEMPVDEVSVPFAGSTGVTLPELADVDSSVDLSVGVVDSTTAAVEPVAEIERRIERLVDAVGPERLVLTTDCGLRPLPRESAFGKLGNLVTAAESVRRTLG